MTGYRKAIEERVSRRAYLPAPLARADTLRERAAAYNRESGLRVRLVEDDPALFKGFTASYGMFAGVRHYFALIGPDDDPCLNEKTGYWGELLALDATLMGLGTCWVGGTFRRGLCESRLGLSQGERLVCLLVVGEAPPAPTGRERLVRRVAHRGGKPLDELYTADDPDERFLDGMRAVRRAPSAMNRQPAHFTLADGVVTAEVPDRSSLEGVDLGIAMLHFEIGARVDDRFRPVSGHYRLRL